MILDVNNKEVIKLTAKLERMHRSAFPSAVRNTLNDAAFETRNLLPTVGAKKFKYQRNKSFLKTFSTVDKAKGFNMRTMGATVGIDAKRDKVLAENLESQEFGGSVRGKKIVPHDDSRTGKSKGKRVASPNWKDKIKAHNANSAYRSHRGNRRTKFVAAAVSTAASGRTRMKLDFGNRGMIYEIKNVRSNIRKKKVNFKVKKLYVVRNNNSASLSKKVPFMRSSATAASKKMEGFYKKNAEFQFKKALR